MEFIDLKTQQARIRVDVERRIRQVLDHGRYILGPEVSELEQRLAAYVGRRHCLAVASGTDALLMALMALGVGQGDEVITTPFTFVATAEVGRRLGARVVFADIEPDTWNLDPEKLDALITPKTRAIMPVDLFGQCADYAAIDEIAARHGIAVVADAAQSMGATQRGKPAGAFGTIAATSFYPTKPLGGYGDGGAVFTDDDALAERLREIRVHGQSGAYEYARLGINGRLDSLQCAIVLAKLSILDDENHARQAAAERYGRLLPGRVQTPVIRAGNASAWAHYTIEVDDRDDVRRILQGAGVPTQIYYPKPLHLQPPYRDGQTQLPVAEHAAQRVLSLPMHPYLDTREQQAVAETLMRAIA